MNTMLPDLDAIVSHLSDLDRPVVDLLQPGLATEEVAATLKSLSVTPPNELFGLYGWCNGTKVLKGDNLDDLHFFPGFYFLSLEDALKTYLAFESESRWNKKWFPLFANGGGDFYAISCSIAKCDHGEITGFLLGEAEQVVEFESLVAMIATVRKCYDTGVYWVSEAGYLEADDRRQAQIAKQLNPHLAIYNE